MKTIYLDHHATTPVDPAVLKAMLPYFRVKFGNSGSNTHAPGFEAAKAVEKARAQVAALVGADPREIVFTSGGTEANNLALKGAAEAYREKGRHFVTAVFEHKSVLDPLKRLEAEGAQVTRLGVSPDGFVDPREVEHALRPDTVLVSVMHAQNEIGTIQPVEEIGRLTRARGVLFHCDAIQSAGKIPIDVEAMKVDLLTMSAHKLYGPKGSGALYIRKSEPRARVIPQIDGGSQETGMRSGTPNVPGIVGFGVAAVLAARRMPREARRLTRVRDLFLKTLREEVPDAFVNGSLERRSPGSLNVGFPGVFAGDVLQDLPQLAISLGSACIAQSAKPSYVLSAIGLDDDTARASMRIGFGHANGEGDARKAARLLGRAVLRRRGGR